MGRLEGVILVDLKRGGLLLFDRAYLPHYGFSEPMHPMNLAAILFALHEIARSLYEDDGPSLHSVEFQGRAVHLEQWQDAVLCCVFGPRVLCNALVQSLDERGVLEDDALHCALECVERAASGKPSWYVLALFPEQPPSYNRCNCLLRRALPRHLVFVRKGDTYVLENTQRANLVACALDARCQPRDVWKPTSSSLACSNPYFTLYLEYPQDFDARLDANHLRDAAELAPIVFGRAKNLDEYLRSRQSCNST